MTPQKTASPLRRILPAMNVFFSLSFALFTLHLLDTFSSCPLTTTPAIPPPKPPGPGYIIHPEPTPRKPPPSKRKWLSIWNEVLWTPISFH